MRAVVGFLLTLVFVLAIVWVGLWWYAEGRMADGFAGWASQLATQGWKISYDSEHRGTSPLAASFTVTNLSLSPPADAQGRTAVITAPSFGLRVDALNPLVLHNDLPHKINIDVANSFDVAVTFGTVSNSQIIDPHLLFSHQPYPFKSGDGAATDISILASEGSLLVLHIDKASAHIDENRNAGAASPALSLTEEVDGLALSPLMTKVASIPFGGAINHFAFSVVLSGPVPQGLLGLNAQIAAQKGNLPAQEKIMLPVLHGWAAAGGNGKLSLGLAVGPSTLTSAATLKFDASAQPSGTVEIMADHLDQFTAAITSAYPQVSDRIAQVEAQLSPYLTTTSAGQTLNIHAVYGNGALMVNGQKLAPMPPIDWTALQNAQP
jgi:hypothetical protein